MTPEVREEDIKDRCLARVRPTGGGALPVNPEEEVGEEPIGIGNGALPLSLLDEGQKGEAEPLLVRMGAVWGCDCGKP